MRKPHLKIVKPHACDIFKHKTMIVSIPPQLITDAELDLWNKAIDFAREYNTARAMEVLPSFSYASPPPYN